MNSTYTKPDSYDMTPSRDELPPKPPASQDNYGIDDLKSDEVTNSELISPSKKKKYLAKFPQSLNLIFLIVFKVPIRMVNVEH